MTEGSEERQMVLRMLHEKRITPGEAEELLAALDRAGVQSDADEEAPGQPDSRQPELDFGELGRDIRAAVKGLSEGLRKFSGWLPWEGDFAEWFGASMGGAKLSIERDIPVPPESEGARVRLRAASGDVTVEGVDSGRVTGRARITVWAPDEASARKAAEGIQLSATMNAGVLEIEAKAPEAKEGADRAAREALRFSVAASIRVPRATDLTVTTVSGDVDASGIEGALAVNSASGDVCLRSCRASPLKVSSTSGDVELDLLEGPETRAEISSSSGDVTLRVSADARVRVEATASGGEVTVRAPFRVEETGRSRFVGILNSPDGSVRLSSANGDIRIETLGE